MNPDKQRIAIAEACGAEPDRHFGNDLHWHWPGGHLAYFNELPDYLNDLNAIHAAVKKILIDGTDYQLCNKYAGILEDILEREILKEDPKCIPDVIGIEIIHAEAKWRAEALLRTIGKWVEEK